MKFHHIGLACKDIEKAKAVIKKTHTVTYDSGNVVDKEQDVTLCLLKTNEGPDIELISGVKIENLLRKGITYYHICYEVEDIEESIKKLVMSGGSVISFPKPAILFGMEKVAFLSFSYGIVELLEKNKLGGHNG